MLHAFITVFIKQWKNNMRLNIANLGNKMLLANYFLIVITILAIFKKKLDTIGIYSIFSFSQVIKLYVFCLFVSDHVYAITISCTITEIYECWLFQQLFSINVEFYTKVNHVYS